MAFRHSVKCSCTKARGPPRRLRQFIGEDAIEDLITEFVLENSKRIIRTARVAPHDISEEARPTLIESLTNRDVVLRYERLNKEDYYFMNGEQVLFYSTKV